MGCDLKSTVRGAPPPGDLSAFVSETLGGLRYDLGVVHSAVRMGRCVRRKEGRKEGRVWVSWGAKIRIY